MTDSGLPIGRRLRVKYSFWGAQRELEQTFALAPGERRIETGVIAVVGPLKVLHHGGLVLLTDRRLCLLVHYGFRPDHGFELPRGSLLGVRRIGFPPLGFLRLDYRTAHGMAHLDIGATTGHELLKAIKKGWGSDAPQFDEDRYSRASNKFDRWLRKQGTVTRVAILLATLFVVWSLARLWPA